MVIIKRKHHHYFLSVLGIIGFIISAFYVTSLNTAAGFLLTLFFIFLFLEAYIGGVRYHADEMLNSPSSVLPYKVAPLSSGYMATSIIGALVSFLFIYPKFSPAWGTAFGVVFIIMFIASVISMTQAPITGQLEKELHMESLDVGRLTNRRK